MRVVEMLRIRRSGAPEETDRAGPFGLVAKSTIEIDRFGICHYGETPDASLAGIWGQTFPVVRIIAKNGYRTADILVSSRQGASIWVDAQQGRIYQPPPGCLGGWTRASRAIRAEVAGRQYVFRFRGIGSTKLTRDGDPVLFTSPLGRRRFTEDADATDIAVGLLIEWVVTREPMRIIG
jgi:hypothetical protein